VEIRKCTDAELVQKMFPRPGQQAWEIEAAWHEFIGRFECILVKAIRLTYRRYAPVRRLTHEDVLDLVQQIFLKLSENDYRALRELKCNKEGSVRLFLYAVAANMALDYLRATQVAGRSATARSLSEPKHEEEWKGTKGERLYAKDSNPEELYLYKELIEQVLAVVDRESDQRNRARNRKIFIMALRDGYTRSEIAAQTGIDLKRPGINSFLKRIKKKIEQIYNPADLTEVER
jgi:RNA polymerase sigma factor (sigma-70 family)